MKWKRKARIQNLVARLPSGLSHAVYYFLQRKFGALRAVNPLSGLLTGVAVLDRIAEQGRTARFKTFLELGTGRRLNLAIALWLGGASKIITVDLNPYLKPELVLEDLVWMRNFPWEIRALFGSRSRDPLFQQRFEQLLRAAEGSLVDLCRMMNVRYLSPADAAALPLPPETVDYHVSCRVLEHLPPETLKAVLREGKRLLKPTGLFVHLVDFADHFSPMDPSISTINFLRFSDAEWECYAGNRFMYQNRLRVNELVDLFRQAGLATSLVEPEIDPRALDELKNDFPLDERFAALSPEQIATATAWIVASLGEPRGSQP